MAQHIDTTLVAAKDALIAAMRSESVIKVTIEYSGCGDSGQIDTVSLERSNPDLKLRNDLEIAGFTPYKEEPTTFSSIESAAEGFGDFVLEHEHSNWEDGEGGSGTILIDAAIGMVEWEHNDFYTESDTTNHKF